MNCFSYTGTEKIRKSKESEKYLLYNLCGKSLGALRVKKTLTLLVAGLLISLNNLAQQDTAIVRTFGGPYYEEGRQIIECADGGYAVIGTTGSDQFNNTNFYLLRLDEELNCLWNRNYGGAEVEWGYSLVEDESGNFILCGYTNSYGEGGYDIMVYKVNPQGDVIWEKTYGGSDWDFAYKMIEHPEGGYLICGKTYSYGNGGSDAYLLHINNDGNLINEWTYGGEGDDEFRDLEIVDSNFDVILLFNRNLSSNIEPNIANIISLNSDLDFIMEIPILSVTNQIAKAIDLSLKDNNILILLSAYVDGSWSNYIVVKKNHLGITQWSISGDYMSPACINFTQDDGYILTGTTTLFGLGASGLIIEKRNSDGVYQSAPTFGGVFNDNGISLFINESGQPVFIGNSESYSNGENYDLYIIKLPLIDINQEYYLQLSSNSCFQISVDENILDKSDLYVYNNKLHSNSIKENTLFIIYDVIGKQVMLGNSSDLPLDISNLQNGSYFIQFVDLTFTTKKIIKY